MSDLTPKLCKDCKFYIPDGDPWALVGTVTPMCLNKDLSTQRVTDGKWVAKSCDYQRRHACGEEALHFQRRERPWLGRILVKLGVMKP